MLNCNNHTLLHSPKRAPHLFSRIPRAASSAKRSIFALKNRLARRSAKSAESRGSKVERQSQHVGLTRPALDVTPDTRNMTPASSPQPRAPSPLKHPALDAQNPG